MKRALVWMLLCLALAPAAAYAQATISGVVRDTSGAVLPGVTVEVASPVLIEKVRTTVTDGSGAYQIIQLLPGTYTATFTLPGFSTTKRDGIELSGSFVATVNAELRVGELAETITVTGQTALVDVRSAKVQKVVTKEVVDSVPTGRLGINLAALQPGMMLGAAGGVGQANTNALNRRTSAAPRATPSPTCRSTAASPPSSDRPSAACRRPPPSASASRSAARPASPPCRRCR